MIIVTAPEFAEIDALAARCSRFLEEFDEEQWEEGLRLILGSSVVDEMKRVKKERPDADFPVRVGEWLSRT